MAPEFPLFRPRLPWLSGDMQTLRNFVRRPFHDLSAWPETGIELPLGDGTGDVLLGRLHSAPHGARRPLVMLIHGLAGCADSFYIRAAARHLLSLDYSVLRLDLRGAGAACGRCRQQYHAGRSEDLRAALAALARAPAVAGAELFAVGFSLGANLLLKYLGEEGTAARLRAAVSVSAPIDLDAASRRMMARRNRPYQHYLLTRMRAEVLAGSAMMSEAERREVERARTIYAFDDRFVAPRYRFSGAGDYYARCSAQRFLAGIRVPTLIIHALDDPWIPSDAYRRQDWTTLPTIRALLPLCGGHVGFHGVGSRVAWHDRCAGTFFEQVGS